MKVLSANYEGCDLNTRERSMDHVDVATYIDKVVCACAYATNVFLDHLEVGQENTALWQLRHNL